MLGSAPTANIWLMLEYAGKWGKKAFEESALPTEFKTAFGQKINEIGNSRLLFVKQENPAPEALSFFIALPKEYPPALLRIQFTDYEELLKLDLNEIIANPEAFASYHSKQAIFLVCTNGLRDKCCARNGVPAFRQLSQAFNSEIWQSSHHGGHRFSANMLYMPYGLSFGQIDMGDSVESVHAIKRGEIPLTHFRGRVSYPKLVQAGEALLLGEIGSQHTFDLKFDGENQFTEDSWELGFSNQSKDKKYKIRVKRTETDKMLFASCIGEKQVPVVHYALIAFEQE